MVKSLRILVPALAAAGSLTLSSPASATTLFTSDYSAGLSSWSAVQQQSGASRVTTAAAPGSVLDLQRPTVPVMRVELRKGDRYQGRARSEVYGRTPKRMTTTTASDWPDPVGSTRYYRFSVFVPTDFATVKDTTWLDLAQWKGLDGGSPPVALEVKRDRFRLGGSRANDGAYPSDDLGALDKGRWTTFVFGMHLSTSADDGWVEVYRDGLLVRPRAAVSTMDAIDGHPDPVYFKQGIYRSTTWTATHVVDFGPTRVTTSLAEALWPGSLTSR